MMDANSNPIPFLLDLYKENTTHGRQHETQRQLVTGGVAALTAALLSAMAALKFHPATLPLAMFVIFAGIVGKRFSQKFYERFRYHMTLAETFRTRLGELCPEARLEACREGAKIHHKKHFPQSSEEAQVRLNKLWLTLNGVFMWLGIACAVLILANWAWFLKTGKYLVQE
jgi:hypothetical protein